MATSLTQQVADLNKRVTAVENSGLDSKETITRITKIYGNIRVTAAISVKTHDYLPAGAHVMAGQFMV